MVQAIEMEMQKVRARESKVDQQLQTIANKQKERDDKDQAERDERLQQQQRAEKQIADLKKEVLRQKQKAKEALKLISPEKQHPLHMALQQRQNGGEATTPKAFDHDDNAQESHRREKSREDYKRLQDTIDQNIASTISSPSTRDNTLKGNAGNPKTPLGYGVLSNEGLSL